MSEIDWAQTKYFAPHEWPAGVLPQMNPELLHEVFELRSRVSSAGAMTPSPLHDAHVRATGSSRHSTNNGQRLSDATDLFVASWTGLWEVWREAQRLGFGGIGVYADTRIAGKPRPMVHLDMRPERVLWLRHSGAQYVYYNSDPIAFFRAVADHCKGV